MPSRTTREKLLTHFAEERGFTVPGDVAHLLAEALPISPRELRGIAIQLESTSRNERRPLDLSIAQTVLEDATITCSPSLAQITRVVARMFDVTARDLKSTGRLQGLVLPRQIAMFAGREWSQKPYAEIGKFFGRRSHSTIVHACQRIRARMDSETDFCRLLESLQEQLNIPLKTL
jgi:chromosomal replication initiator protein